MNTVPAIRLLTDGITLHPSFQYRRPTHRPCLSCLTCLTSIEEATGIPGVITVAAEGRATAGCWVTVVALAMAVETRDGVSRGLCGILPLQGGSGPDTSRTTVMKLIGGLETHRESTVRPIIYCSVSLYGEGSRETEMW